jgi:hypothetical protein
MTPTRFKLGFGLATLLAGATVAHAVPTTLELEAALPKTLGPQSTSAPCIIAGTQCKNPDDFPFTNFKQGGNIPAYDEDSPTYTIDQFPFLNFNVAIDVNTTSDAGETLQLFSVFVDADGAAGAGGFDEIYNFTGPGPIGDASNAGNGFGDWMLGPIDLSSFADDALVFFNAVWDGATGGAESFFLVEVGATPPPVPEPGTLLLMSLGLLGLSVAHGRKQRNQRNRR